MKADFIALMVAQRRSASDQPASLDQMLHLGAKGGVRHQPVVGVDRDRKRRSFSSVTGCSA